MTTSKLINSQLIADINAEASSQLKSDYQSLGERLDRRQINIDEIVEKTAAFSVAIPSWGMGTGGTRFGRFPGEGEPENIFEKLEDCAVIQQLSRATPSVSTHFPWDDYGDTGAVYEKGESLGLTFDAVNSNTFQDQPGQPVSYKYGSLSHTDKAVREQAIAHNLECITQGQVLGSKALTVWVPDGSNFPGQQNFRRAFERYLVSMESIYAALPDDWQLFIEHKLFEPAFYSTVISDWGSNYIATQHLGEKAKCLVDLGHHAPSVNIEQIVARLAQMDKLGGFHFNDSKYGDDDLDCGSIAPYQLFLIFNELLDAAECKGPDFNPAYMMDQSHNVTDPIESLLTSAMNLQNAYCKSLLVDRSKLDHYQQHNDVIMANQTLKAAFDEDVRAISAVVRIKAGGAIEPLEAYRKSGYRADCARQRVPQSGSSAGIV
ncbi:MAG: L-rhamnose catabolism isomerase [Xanthomonadales bacterium]|nr:L-rhamnose catabolism isomerase [Xanthomonadales bacterium]